MPIDMVFKFEPSFGQMLEGISAKHLDTAVIRTIRSTSNLVRQAIKYQMKEESSSEPHNVYSNWFGKMGEVNIAGLLKANKPRAVRAKAKGSKRKRTPLIIRPPARVEPWGKLMKLIQYFVNDDKKMAKVGLIPERRGGKLWADIWLRQQEGGPAVFYSNGEPISDRNRGYFGSLGLYIKRGTAMKITPRPVMLSAINKVDVAPTLERIFLLKLKTKGRYEK